MTNASTYLCNKTLIIRIYAQCRHDNDRREEVNEERENFSAWSII